MTDIAWRVSSNEGGSDDKSIRGGGLSGVHGGLWQQLSDGAIRDDPGIHGRDVGRQFLGLQQLDGYGQHDGPGGLGAMTWQLTQSGSAVTGSMSFSGMQGGRAGSFSGTMSGEDMTLTMDLPSGSMMSSGCSARATGTARVSGTTMTGSYSGSNSCTDSFMNGQMTMTRR